MFTLGTFYKSKQWEKFRATLITERTNEQGDLICEHCGKPIVHRYDCIGHHKIPLTEANVNDFTISLNPDNIAFVHSGCHNKIHNKLGSYTRHIYIVWGSPCSGKTSYVMENALKDDLIIDIDRIYGCIGIERSNRLYPNVMAIYNQLIDMVRTRNGRWVNAWIMRTLPVPIERERLANLVGGELIHIDTPKEVCLERAGKDPERFKWVNQYWEKYIDG